ncbi:hypothetical protein SAMN04489796_102259 [Winogradskyella thalassocola]|uniref:Uncharacterized protein n=1 Tax=Winogradskyella thalassocola TaxID=262004 RepID=A0A1G8BBB3_9FLAO|nr:hypothetical protein SAMN04489796_102259 [Winogradskyella thalassocola]
MVFFYQYKVPKGTKNVLLIDCRNGFFEDNIW